MQHAPTEPTLIDEAAAQPDGRMTDTQIARVVEEVADPAASTDVVRIGDRAIHVSHLTWKDEKPMMRIIAKYLHLLLDAAIEAEYLDEMIGALLVEATDDLENVAVIVLLGHLKGDPAFLPRQATDTAPAATTDDLIRDWLGEAATFEQLVTLVRTQIRKNKVADNLGKLYAPAALGVRTLKVLSTLRSLNMPGSPSNSTESPSGMGSTTPM